MELTMHPLKRWWICVPAVFLLAVTACTNDALDDGDGPDVALEITALDNQPVTAETAMGGLCTLEIMDWQGTAENNPLSALATTSPFNDIVLETVTISYDWNLDGIPDPGFPTRVVGLGDIRIPAAGSNSFSFSPIAFQDLTAAVLGQTGNLTLLFSARTVEGETLRTVALRQMFVEACPP